MARTLRAPLVSLLVTLWLVVSCSPAQAHTPDTSYLHAVVSKHALELRFTFDLATLHRVVRLDPDGDGRVTRAEVETATPDIGNFISQAITLELNGADTKLSTPPSSDWPADAGDAVVEKDYGQKLLHFTFSITTKDLIEDFYVLYEVFEQLGAQHRALADIEQEGKRLEVVFTQVEPDYVYDTFWRSEANEARNGFASYFREGVKDAWSLWWIPALLLLIAALAGRRSAKSCLGALLFIGIALWLFLVMDSEPTPGRSAWAVGVAAGIMLVAVLVWPVQMTMAAIRQMRM